MLGWLYNLIIGQFCNHKWIDYHIGNLKNQEGIIYGLFIILKCEKCGKLKKQEFIAE